MRTWKHHTSEAWMRARHGLVTASAITTSRGGGLVAANKKFVPGKLNKEFVRYWMKINSEGYDECDSSGWAARGHIMEPYAVAEFNDWRVAHGISAPEMHHWDDAVIVSGQCGFSPDAMDVPQRSKEPRLETADLEPSQQPHAILEIKSYSPEQHAAAILKGTHPERWQVAFAMHVMPTIEDAWLMFYCPGSPVPRDITKYTRENLEKELATIDEIVERYLYIDAKMKKRAEWDDCMYSEDEIYEDWLNTQNPTFDL